MRIFDDFFFRISRQIPEIATLEISNSICLKKKVFLQNAGWQATKLELIKLINSGNSVQ